MKQVEPIFSDILQNAIDAIEGTATPSDPMLTVNFYPNELKAAEMAIYSVLARLQVEAETHEKKANEQPPTSTLRAHHRGIANHYKNDVNNLRMAANALYHATKRESRPR